MQEESDGEIRALLAQDARQKLQLVVLYPYGGALGGDLVYLICKTQVDLAIGVPPIAVIGRGDDEIVVERPQGGIRKAFVKALEIGLGELDWVQQHAGIGAEGLRCGIGHTGPAHPAALVRFEDWRQSGDQTARRGRPGMAAIRLGFQIYRQAVGHHHEVIAMLTHGARIT